MASFARRLLSKRRESCGDNCGEHTEAENPVRSLADSDPIEPIQFLPLDVNSLVAMPVGDVVRGEFLKEV